MKFIFTKIFKTILRSFNKIKFLHIIRRGDNELSEFEEKVLNLLEKINEKLERLLGSKTTETISSSPSPSVRDSYVKPSAVVEKQEEEEKALEKPPVEGRRICPDCGGTSFNAVEDKENVLHQLGGVKIYAKKYICKKCGKEM